MPTIWDNEPYVFIIIAIHNSMVVVLKKKWLTAWSREGASL